MDDPRTLRLAALADVHYDEQAQGSLTELFAAASEAADVLLLCGDLTDFGRPQEAETLAADLEAHVEIPIVGVLGNHDFEAERPDTVKHLMGEAGVTILDGTSVIIDGVGFAGASGFGGGFDEFILNAWGEPLVKQFVQASIDEALKLEKALSQLHTDHKIALLHYAPVRATVEGEPPEIFPFLGSSRLAGPLNRFQVTAAFHGHAHHGTSEGHTTDGIPVYNVSIPVLQDAHPDRPAFQLFDVEL